MTDIKIPATVLELAKRAVIKRVPDPRPIAWAEYPDRWVVVFEDGRKLTFDKVGVEALVDVKRGAGSGERIDLSDGVDFFEATLAGKALNKRKEKKV